MPADLFIGTSGWNYPDWKGRFYPADLKPKEYLAHYARHFRTTEVNYSFYHLPRTTTYENWAAQVPDEFIFSLKASRTITHIRRLHEAGELWQEFLRNASLLGRKLGPVLLQFPPSFKRNAELLVSFFQESLRFEEFKGRRLAFEFRHESWFDIETYDILRKHGSALVIADSKRYPEAPCVPTAPFVYLRLHGPGALLASSYSQAELEHMARRIRKWLAAGSSVHVYFNNDFHGYAIENARILAGLV